MRFCGKGLKCLATVITNMASAVPYIGSDLVQFLWGGFKTEGPIKNNFKILKYAGNSSKLTNIRRQSAGIGIRYYSQIPQRLNLEDLTYAKLSGLIEGDGWFSISKKGKYLTYEFGIAAVGCRDIDLIYQIKELLGIGTITFKKVKTSSLKESKSVVFRVRCHVVTINIILPIFDKYPFFSNKQRDYLIFKIQLCWYLILFIIKIYQSIIIQMILLLILLSL